MEDEVDAWLDEPIMMSDVELPFRVYWLLTTYWIFDKDGIIRDGADGSGYYISLTFRQLSSLTKRDLLRLPGCGHRTVKEVEDVLQLKQLRFRLPDKSTKLVQGNDCSFWKALINERCAS